MASKTTIYALVKVIADNEVVEAAEYTLDEQGESVEVRVRNAQDGKVYGHYLEHQGGIITALGREEVVGKALRGGGGATPQHTPDTSLPPLVPDGPRRKMLVEIDVSDNFERRLDNQWEVEREINADRWAWHWAEEQ